MVSPHLFRFFASIATTSGIAIAMFSLSFPMLVLPVGSLNFNASPLWIPFVAGAGLLLVGLWRQWTRAGPWIAGAWVLLAIAWFFIAGQAAGQGIGRELGWGWLPLGLGIALAAGGTVAWSATA